MVYVKVTDGAETRRLQVIPGELTFEQLKDKIATLFPKTAEQLSNLSVQYRDTDGDVITLSSDGEFQEVLSELPENYVWKLHISTPAASPAAQPCQGASRLGHILRPSSQSTNPWAAFDRQVQETQKLLELFFGQDKSTEKNADSETAGSPETKTEEEGEKKEGESTTADSAETTDSETVKPKEGEDEEVRSKLKEEDKKKKAESEAEGTSHCRVRVLDPLLLSGLLGFPRVVRPAHSYRITWSPRHNCSCSVF